MSVSTRSLSLSTVGLLFQSLVYTALYLSVNSRSVISHSVFRCFGVTEQVILSSQQAEHLTVEGHMAFLFVSQYVFASCAISAICLVIPAISAICLSQPLAYLCKTQSTCASTEVCRQLFRSHFLSSKVTAQAVFRSLENH